MTSPPGPTLDPRPNEDILLSASIQNLMLKTLLVKRYLLALNVMLLWTTINAVIQEKNKKELTMRLLQI